MRATWPALHAQLMRSTETLSFRKTFETLRQISDSLRPFPDPACLVERLHARDGNTEAKNRILANLMAARANGDCRGAADTLLWLALWPGLDAIYRRLLRRFAVAPDDLTSEISKRLAEELHRFVSARVERIAATILRNIERDIGTALRTRASEMAARADPRELDALPATAPELDAEAAVRRIVSLLEPAIGNDALLVVAVALLGETQAEAARHLGIGHDAARKRYRRAIRCLSTQREKICAGLSHSARQTRF